MTKTHTNSQGQPICTIFSSDILTAVEIKRDLNPLCLTCWVAKSATAVTQAPTKNRMNFILTPIESLLHFVLQIFFVGAFLVPSGLWAITDDKNCRSRASYKKQTTKLIKKSDHDSRQPKIFVLVQCGFLLRVFPCREMLMAMKLLFGLVPLVVVAEGGIFLLVFVWEPLPTKPNL